MSPSKNSHNLFLSAIASCASLFLGAEIQMNLMLRSVGVTSTATAISLAGSDKVNFALYLTFVAASMATMVWAAIQIRGDHIHLGGIIAIGGFLTSVVIAFLPLIQGYTYSGVGLVPIGAALLMMGGVSYYGYKTPALEKLGLKLTPKEIAVISLLSALTAVITGSTGIMLPSLTGGYTHVGDTIIYVAALVFGSKVGGVVGIIGPMVVDLFVGYTRWFVTVLAHGSQGFIAGLARKRSIGAQVVILALSGVVMAGSYFFVNVFIKGYPIAIISFVRDLFGQALVSIILGLILSKTIEKYLPSQLS